MPPFLPPVLRIRTAFCSSQVSARMQSNSSELWLIWACFLSMIFGYSRTVYCSSAMVNFTFLQQTQVTRVSAPTAFQLPEFQYKPTSKILRLASLTLPMLLLPPTPIDNHWGQDHKSLLLANESPSKWLKKTHRQCQWPPQHAALSLIFIRVRPFLYVKILR